MDGPYNNYEKYDDYDTYNNDFNSNNTLNNDGNQFSQMLVGIIFLVGISFLSVCCRQQSRYDTDLSIRNNTLNENLIETINQSEENYNINIHNNEECSICLDYFNNDKKIIKLNCDHIFHTECIKLWIENNNTCPLCRTKEII